MKISFGLVRFLGKSTGLFVAILTFFTLIKDFSQPVQSAISTMASVWWGLPLLYTAWVPLHFGVEVLSSVKQRQLEVRRRIASTARGNPPRRRR